jgi:hypothetical protein
MRTTVKFAISRREEGEVLGLEAPTELDANKFVKNPDERSRQILSNSTVGPKTEANILGFSLSDARIRSGAER